jgi:RimJ/RimL family protein N-acetyltransferase
MVTIRPIKAGDREGFYHLVKENTARLADYFPITVEKAASLETAAECIKMYNFLADKNELHVMMIERDTDKKIVGMVFIKNIDQKTSKCELAYFVDKDEEGKGISSSAVKESIGIAFNQLNLNKVFCRVAPDNLPSNRVAQKNGFELEGVLKQEFRIQNGSLVDLNYYGLLKN